MNPQPPENSGTRRNAAIDVLRGIAVLSVLSDHWQDAYTEFHIPASIIQLFFDYCGWFGVDLFFVLSGFLVSGLLFTEYQRLGVISPTRFLIRRGFKIYPGFYAFLGVSCAIAIARGQFVWKRALSEALFVQNYFPRVFVHSWSLAVEEHFYFSLALVLLLLSRSGVLRDRRRFLALGFGTILLVFALRVVNALAAPAANLQGHKFPLGMQYTATHLRLDGLLFGVMLSYLFHFDTARFTGFCARWRAPLIAMGLLTVVAVAPWLTLQRYHLYPSNAFWLGTVGFTLLYLGWGAVLMGAIALPTSAWRNPVARMVSWVGLYSYSIYLWHLFASPFVVKGMQALHLTAWPHVMMLVYAVIAVGAGYVAARAVEMPMLALRERVFPRTA